MVRNYKARSGLQRFSSGYKKRTARAAINVRRSSKPLYKRRKTQQLLSLYGWKNNGKELKWFKPVTPSSATPPGPDTTTDLEVNTQTIGDVLGTDTYIGWCLNAIRQGSDVNNREGRQINMKYVEITGSINPDSNFVHQVNSNLVHENIRMLVVLDNSNNSGTSVPTLSTILDQESTPATITQPTNLNYRQRFRILCDKVFTFGWGTSAGGGGQQTATIHEKIQLNDRVNYSQNGPTIGNIADKSLLIYFYARNQGFDSSPTVTNYYRDIQIQSRLRFTE
jgi:hypothetical protein